MIERPARKLLLKRGIKARDYYEYCEEVGMWLPNHLIKEGTSLHVQGVELPLDYHNKVPEGFDQGEPYNDDDFEAEIGAAWEQIDKFNPAIYGFQWALEIAPRFQLAPIGYRGYVEARPVLPVE